MTSPQYPIPRVYQDGEAWCAVYGEDIQEGITGWGATAGEAIIDFQRRWSERGKDTQGEWLIVDDGASAIRKSDIIWFQVSQTPPINGCPPGFTVHIIPQYGCKHFSGSFKTEEEAKSHLKTLMAGILE